MCSSTQVNPVPDTNSRTSSHNWSLRHWHNGRVGPALHLDAASPPLAQLRRHPHHRRHPAQGAVVVHVRPARLPRRRRPRLLPGPQRRRQPPHRRLCPQGGRVPGALRRRVLWQRQVRVRGRPQAARGRRQERAGLLPGHVSRGRLQRLRVPQREGRARSEVERQRGCVCRGGS